MELFKNSLCSTTKNEYWALFRGGKGEGGEKKEWHPVSVVQLVV